MTIDGRAYDAWVTREPAWMHKEIWPWMTLARCSFCHAWVSTKRGNLTAQVVHLKKDRCPGSEDDLFWIHDECDVKHAHGPHEVDCYAGISSYYRCGRCGGEAEIAEF